MQMFRKPAKNLSEFKGMIEAFEKKAEQDMRKVPTTLQTFYRGHADCKYSCEPSVFRNGLLGSEDTFFNKCIESLPYEFNHLQTTFDKLAKMQHYGAPTRILDFTLSPEIALFFACCSISGKEDEKDHLNGEVIIYKTARTTQEDIGVRAISMLAKYPNKIDAIFYDKVRMEIGANYTDDYIKSCIEKSYFVIPETSNERLHRQKGLFLIFGQQLDGLYGEKQASNLDENTGRGEGYQGSIGYIKIPASSKKTIREEIKKNHNLSVEYLLPQIDEELKKIKENPHVDTNRE